MTTASASGFVYFIQATLGGPVKIGFAKDVPRRLIELRVGSPVELRLIAKIPGTREDEKAIHRLLIGDHVHGEWFMPGLRLRTILRDRLGAAPRDLVLARSGARLQLHAQAASIPQPVAAVSCFDRIEAANPERYRGLGALSRERDRRLATRMCRGCGGVLGRIMSEHWKVCPARQPDSSKETT